MDLNGIKVHGRRGAPARLLWGFSIIAINTLARNHGNPADWGDIDEIYDALPQWRHDPTDTRWPVEVDSIFVDEIVDLRTTTGCHGVPHTCLCIAVSIPH